MARLSTTILDVLLLVGVSYVMATIVSCLSGLDMCMTLPAAFVMCAVVWVITEILQVPTSGKAVLVTGCDSGFGHALALRLDQLGFRVFAGCLFAKAGGEGALRLKREGSERLHVLQLDLTSNEQLDDVLEEVKNKLPVGEVFWGLVNNAGIALVGNTEWNPVEHFKKVADVNLFGLVAVTKRFLPLIRRCKGRVVNVTSVLGRSPISYNSAYVSSKYAIEGFSDCLRLEMKQFGVKVCIIEPGSHVIATKVLTKEMLESQRDNCWSTMSEEVRAAYGETAFKEAYAAMVDHGEADIQPVIEVMVKSLTQRFPRARYCSANGYYVLRVFISQHLPDWVFNVFYC